MGRFLRPADFEGSQVALHMRPTRTELAAKRADGAQRACGRGMHAGWAQCTRAWCAALPPPPPLTCNAVAPDSDSRSTTDGSWAHRRCTDSTSSCRTTRQRWSTATEVMFACSTRAVHHHGALLTSVAALRWCALCLPKSGVHTSHMWVRAASGEGVGHCKDALHTQAKVRRAVCSSGGAGTGRRRYVHAARPHAGQGRALWRCFCAA